MTPDPASIALVFGLASAISWGAGDFCGGLASRRTEIYSVMIFSQIVGLSLLVLLVLLVGEPLPQWNDLIYGALAGICGSFGIYMLYRAMESGKMGVTAPLSAIVAAAIPVVVGLFLEGLPSTAQMLGMTMALPAVWFLSSESSQARLDWDDLRLPILAGIGFAAFFLIIDQVSGRSVLWPLISARMASTLLFSAIALQQGRLLRPGREHGLLILLTGIFEIGGNVFFALASRFGRLDLAALLASLYPAATVILARLVLKEHLRWLQWLGVLLAILALVLFSI